MTWTFADEVEAYKRRVLEEIATAESVEDVDRIKRDTIGKKGEVTLALKELWSKK